ncbi:MAG: hypothetical protein IPG64_22060 [Haliea sp.]|nr:hypothetical protein [Haliea sp.]
MYADTDYQQFSRELRLNGSVGDVEMTSGLYYWYSDYDTHSTTYDLFEWLAGLPDGSVGTISQHGETESHAAFTSADWAVTDKITLERGRALHLRGKNAGAGWAAIFPSRRYAVAATGICSACR